MKRRPTTMPSARAAALRALSACLTRQLDVQAAVDAELSTTQLSGRDAALTTELVYGCLRHLGRIDHLLDRHLKKPGDLAPGVRRLLQLACFELLFLDKVPAYATVDWAVNAVKERFGEALGRLANAVLRAVDRLGADAATPAFYAQGADALTAQARWYSCPAWLVELWHQAYGPDNAQRYLEAQLSPPPLGLRLRLDRPEWKPLAASLADDPHFDYRDGPTVLLRAGAKPDLDEAMAQGLVTRQSAASQLALRMAEPTAWPELVWDACCGRGGKTFALLEQGLGPVLSSDVSRPRLAGLLREARRLDLPALAFRASATAPAPFARSPGVILLDAPCSGLGVLARRPDSKWKRRPEDLATLADLQTAMVAAAWRSLCPGGLLVYLTCTLNPAETHAPVSTLLCDQPSASLRQEWTTPSSSELREFFSVAVVRKNG